MELNQHIKQLLMDRNSKINLTKLNSRISLEVLTLPVCGCRTYLITCCTALQNVSASKNDLVLQARGFRWAFGLLSLVAMFRYIRFPQITHGKRIVAYIGNRKQICWKNQSALSEKV